MKISEISEQDIICYLKIDESEVDSDLRRELASFRTAAVEYVRTYTGLSAQELDSHDDLTVAVFILISDFYDNRALYLPSNQAQVSKAVENILGLYQINLL